MNKRFLVLNAFRPNAEIENPEAFAGRFEQVKDLSDALMMDGAVPVIYGGRGLGKTSLANQLARIALGDDSLLKSIGAEDRVIDGDNAFIPFWVSCSDETRTKEQMLQRLINSAEGFNDVSSFHGMNHSSTTVKARIKLAVFEAEAIDKYERQDGRSFSKLGIEDQFFAVREALYQKGFERVLFILDEVDRVHSTKGLANFIKNATNYNTRFVIVGIGNTISSLLEDHQSLQRSIIPIAVSRMGNSELADIVNKALIILKTEGVNIMFNSDAMDKIVNASDGFPWFTHVLAQEAIGKCWNESRGAVTVDDVELSINSIATNRCAQQFSDSYQAAVRDSRQREIVLRLMAKWREDDVQLSEIYPIAKELGVSNPYVSKSDLALVRHGAVVVSPPMHAQGVVRFKDSMFKRYVNLRPSLYSGVKESVDDAWSNR